MLRANLLTLEPLSKKGGVARYTEAIALAYPNNVQVTELPLNADYSKIILAFWKSHQQTDMYFIHHVLPVGTVAWLLSYFGSKPYVVFLHGMDFDLAKRNPWKRFLTRRILKRAKRVVTNSEALKREVVEFMRSSAAEPLVVYPCVSDKFVDVARDPSSRPDDTVAVTLLTVGRLVERKGQLKVLDALLKFPFMRYHIAGTGPMRKEYEDEIAKRGLGDRVTMTVDVPNNDLPSVYADADIFVMPTTKTDKDREGFGIVYLEAQLFGLPVIATRHPGVDEAVIDGEGGILIDDNADALAAAVGKLAGDPALRSSMGNKGRERVLSMFTQEKQMSKIRELL